MNDGLAEGESIVFDLGFNRGFLRIAVHYVDEEEDFSGMIK